MAILRHLKKIKGLGLAIPAIERLDKRLLAFRIKQSHIILTRQLAKVDPAIAVPILDALVGLRGSSQLANALHIAQIENERFRLCEDNSWLVDGSFNREGPYDAGQTISDVCRVSKPPRPALFLYLLVRAFQPQSVIELGTNVGVSSSFIAMGLKDNPNGGRLTTFEASPYRLRQAQRIHKNLSLNNIDYIEGLFEDTLRPALSQLSAIDFAFVDGNHQLQPTLNYFNMISEHAKPGALFIFDDIRWSNDMKRAWDILRQENQFSVALDLSSIGVCILRRPNDRTRVTSTKQILW